jgi:hypothetical protein
MLMPRGTGPTPASIYIVPARTLSGSKREMLAALDEAIQALVALRLVILADDSPAQSSSPANR